MSLSIATDRTKAEIDLLMRRWQLPRERVADVERLLAAQFEGGTACTLSSTTSHPAAWGSAGQALPLFPSTSSSPPPLVLRRHRDQDYLQAWRFFSAEQTIASDLLTRAQRGAPPMTRSVADLLDLLGAAQINEQQAKAITCALNHTLSITVGGPGTGKTHTLARFLALLIADKTEAPPCIHLAAPTGKAADRMKEAVMQAAKNLPAILPETTRTALKKVAEGASTLHRLLGFNPATGRCHFNANRKLRSDVVVVDECSMIDTLLWQALLVALEPNTRLVLVGDPHQLESVASGDVLGSLVRFARAHSDSPLDRVVVELTKSQRFSSRAGIGTLAAAVVNCRTDEAVTLLHKNPAPADNSPPGEGLAWLGDHEGRFDWKRLPTLIQKALTDIADAQTPAEALSALGVVRLLTAHRERNLGVSGLNDAIHHHLAKRSQPSRQPNQPIIINHNDPETRLTNGTVGIIMEDSGTRYAYFPADPGAQAPRKMLLSQLPNFSPAWALTIHRSQGSEFDQVVVILPPDDSPLATRELIYTAITRARQSVYVWGSDDTVRSALDDKFVRCTLLEASLEAQISASPTS